MIIIKYRYALNQLGQTIAIDNVKNRAGHYTCINCKKRMGPRLGQINIHHFYHINSQEDASGTVRNCAPETYLHLIAKQLFLDAYCDNKPFVLKWESERRCINKEAYKECVDTKHNTLNLIEKYPYIEVEKRDGEFTPDILLSNAQDEKLYIEFAHTHYASQKKMLSGEQIIEIGIKTEKDIEMITRSRTINAEQENVKLYGFKGECFDCMGACVYPLDEKYHTVTYLRGKQSFIVRGDGDSQNSSFSYEVFLDGLSIGTATSFHKALSVADDYLSKKS